MDAFEKAVDAVRPSFDRGRTKSGIREVRMSQLQKARARLDKGSLYLSTREKRRDCNIRVVDHELLSRRVAGMHVEDKGASPLRRFTNALDAKFGVIHPLGPWKMRFDGFVAVALMICLIVTPRAGRADATPDGVAAPRRRRRAVDIPRRVAATPRR